MSLCLRSMAQTENEAWMRARSAKGRFEVIALDPAQAQKLAFWSERSLKQLEKEWGTAIPFQRNQSFHMRIDPEMPSVELRQEWRQGVLYQTLVMSPASMEQDPQEIAHSFTRAMIYRLGLAALPSNEKNLNWMIPDWLIVGSAHSLLLNRSQMLFEWKILQGSESRTLYPEEISRQMILSPTVKDHADAAMLCRWIFENQPSDFWLALARQKFRNSEIWAQLFPTIGNLRDLHVEWDLWMQQDRKKLIAEFAIDEAAREALEQELKFIPAFYGWKVEGENPYRAVPFSGLKPYLDTPRFELGMKAWVLRLQTLRFRQSPAFNEEVEKYQQAAQYAMEASREQKKKRDKIWLQVLETLP